MLERTKTATKVDKGSGKSSEVPAPNRPMRRSIHQICRLNAPYHTRAGAAP